jgi:hypothetical protein
MGQVSMGTVVGTRETRKRITAYHWPVTLLSWPIHTEKVANWTGIVEYGEESGRNSITCGACTAWGLISAWLDKARQQGATREEIHVVLL